MLKTVVTIVLTVFTVKCPLGRSRRSRDLNKTESVLSNIPHYSVSYRMASKLLFFPNACAPVNIYTLLIYYDGRKTALRTQYLRKRTAFVFTFNNIMANTSIGTTCVVLRTLCAGLFNVIW